MSDRAKLLLGVGLATSLALGFGYCFFGGSEKVVRERREEYEVEDDEEIDPDILRAHRRFIEMDRQASY